jgi:hypothetical protein
MREGISPVKPFDVSDVEAEMAAEKKAKAPKQPEVAGVMAKIKEKLGLGSKNEIRMADEKKLAEARKRIAEGTGEIPLSEEDMEDIEEISNENLKKTN